MNPNIIKLLPDSVANQIAAGEVIQGPASVVKELVENAVDAGATAISIVVKDAGRTLIQVIDNGCGMSPADARMAFERHATSKISSASDLYSLHTMGFRGEALPSIASVAQVELRTMRRDDEMGTCLNIAGAKFESQTPVAATPGTNLMVRNLFFNLPGRRKFLKKDSVELAGIMREFERLALVNPGVDFTMISNDNTLHQLRHASVKQRITNLFGRSLDRNLIPVETATEFVRISGFIGLPSAAKKRGYQQFFSVNGRNMRSRVFHRVVMNCYSQLIAPDAQPSYFINFEVDPDRIDVNVHPQKHEIKFEDEPVILSVLTAAIQESLGKYNVSGAMDFDTADAPEIPAYDPRVAPTAPDEAVDPAYNPFAESAPAQARTSGGGVQTSKPASWSSGINRKPPTDWQKLYESFSGRRAASLDEVRGSALNAPAQECETPATLPGAEALEPTGGRLVQLLGRYIVMPSAQGLKIIDQHRAHVNVLYARFCREEEAPAMQRLAFPEVVELSPSQAAALSAATDIVSDLGFDISPMDGGAWAINGAPATIGSANPAEVVRALAEQVAATGTADPAMLRTSAALSMARAAAISAGRTLSTDEMEVLVADLLRLPSPAFTPDGLRVVATIDSDDITRLFQ